MKPDLNEIRDTIAALPDWEEKYTYLIELGRSIGDFPDHLKSEAHRVHGCQSQVWLVPRAPEASGDERFHFMADSDSLIVRGLIAIVTAVFDGKHPEAILAEQETSIFAELGLDAHLSPGRRNGLRNLVARIKDHARAMVSDERELNAANM